MLFHPIVRFDVGSGKVLHRQSISLKKVEEELRIQYAVEAQQLLQRLWHTLQTFSQFPPAEYLVKSDSKQFDPIKIFEKSNDG